MLQESGTGTGVGPGREAGWEEGERTQSGQGGQVTAVLQVDKAWTGRRLETREAGVDGSGGNGGEGGQGGLRPGQGVPMLPATRVKG